MKGLDPKLAQQLSSLFALRWGSVAVITLALILLTWSQASDETSFCYRYYFRYVSYLQRKLRAMFIFSPPELIPIGQLAAAYALTLVLLIIREPALATIYFIILVAPAWYIDRMRRERLERIDDQLDTFILALANALKSTPSIGAALNSVVSVIEDPIKSEVDLAVKEMKVGSTLEQSLLHMAARVGSRALDSALSSILIGRQVGGNLPKVLETTALTLREMRRLDGVVRTKTAEGRMQLWVIGCMPMVFIVGLNFVMPGYFDPLTKSFIGYVIIAVVTGSWVGAIAVARKVLQVDI